MPRPSSNRSTPGEVAEQGLRHGAGAGDDLRRRRQPHPDRGRHRPARCWRPRASPTWSTGPTACTTRRPSSGAGNGRHPDPVAADRRTCGGGPGRRGHADPETRPGRHARPRRPQRSVLAADVRLGLRHRPLLRQHGAGRRHDRRRTGPAPPHRRHRPRSRKRDDGGQRRREHPPRRDLGARPDGDGGGALRRRFRGGVRGRRRRRAGAGARSGRAGAHRPQGRTGAARTRRGRRPRPGRSRLPGRGRTCAADAAPFPRPRRQRSPGPGQCAAGRDGAAGRYLPAGARRPPGLLATQRGARRVLAAGGVGTPIGRGLLDRLEARMRSLHVSPGGAADLLAAALLLDRLESLQAAASSKTITMETE
jgi:hypothetical protein